MGYCTVADVRARLAAELSDRGEGDLELAIEAATARIEQETGRVFEAGAEETRIYAAIRDEYCLVHDLLSVSGVLWEGVPVASGDFWGVPLYSPLWMALRGPWRAGDEVSVTGVFAYSDPPPHDIWEVCVMWVIRTIKSADAAYGDATAVPELGQLVYRSAIPAEVRRVLERYRRVTPVR
jgi:hypothetical protein